MLIEKKLMLVEEISLGKLFYLLVG